MGEQPPHSEQQTVDGQSQAFVNIGDCELETFQLPGLYGNVESISLVVGSGYVDDGEDSASRHKLVQVGVCDNPTAYAPGPVRREENTMQPAEIANFNIPTLGKRFMSFAVNVSNGQRSFYPRQTGYWIKLSDFNKMLVAPSSE